MELEDSIITLTTILGFISLCKSLLTFLKWLHSTFLRKPKNLRFYGSWVVVTGATDGIGKALAFDLASKGLNLVLIGRNPKKLEATSNEIMTRETKCRDGVKDHVQVKTIVIDFANSTGEEIAAAIKEGTLGLDVGVVINNAGMAYPSPRYFHEVDEELMSSMLRVNVNGMIWVTKAVLPGMLKKKRGAIVNIGSASSVCVSSFPLESLYASTKAFIAMFSRSISYEYEMQGIHIQCQVPLFIATKMTKLTRSILVPTAEAFSQASLRWIGHHDRTCDPHWLHSIEGFVLRNFDAIAVWKLRRQLEWRRENKI